MVDISSNPPNFDLSLNNKGINAGLRRLIDRVEFESVDGMADALNLKVNDPPGKGGVLTVRDSKLFSIGNIIGLYGGYGAKLRHIGHAVIRKTRMVYGDSGPPMLEVIAYSRDSEMMDDSPPPPSEVEEAAAAADADAESRGRRKRAKGPAEGRRFTDSKYSDAVTARAKRYGFLADVDETPEEPTDFIQKVGMSDYDFVLGLANIAGFVFWVDTNEAGIWTLHFKDPGRLSPDDVGQSKVYNFKWNEGDYSTVLGFEPELAIQGANTQLKVVSKDSITGLTVEVDVVDRFEASDILLPSGPSEYDLGNPGQIRQIGRDLITNELTSGSSVKLVAGDYSFAVQSTRRFATPDELSRWARNWWRKNRDNFIQARVRLIGLETLRARQTHKISGVGTQLSGEYYFNRVRHVFDSNGYSIDANTRKIVDTEKPDASVAFSQIEPGAF